MPVCICGMHRSGTSMITRLLHECGLHLGAEEDIITPKKDNPAGFWENIRFLEINELLLHSIGGAWDVPPADESIAALAITDTGLENTAMELLNQFEDIPHWGWKDPRSSLTLPFWKKIVPDMKLLICLRNPLEVMQSINKRNNNSYLFGLSLWYRYSLVLMQHSVGVEKIVTHYDSWFIDPLKETKRVLDFFGIETTDKVIDAAIATIDPSLRMNRQTRQNLQASGVAESLVTIYDGLCDQAGPVFNTTGGE